MYRLEADKGSDIGDLLLLVLILGFEFEKGASLDEQLFESENLDFELGFCEGMGLGESVVVEGEDSTCSICLEVVMSGGGRSMVKLQCGHEFHLDCVGSAFNAKGTMQCPNCRNVEKGSWLYGNGNCFLQSVNMDEWTHDDELYDLNFLEMPYTIRWCPVSRIGRVTSSFENGESFPSVAFQDIEGHNVITELPSMAVPAHPCPHISGFHQAHSASAPTFHASSDGVTDTSLYYHQWSQFSESTEVSSSPSLHSGDPYFRGWDRYPSTYSHPRDITTPSIQAPVSQAAPRGTRLVDAGPPRARSLSYSVLGRHGSHSLPMLPHHHSSNRGHAHAHELHRQANISGDPWRSGNSSFAGRFRWPPSNHFGFYVCPLPVSFNSSLGDVVIDTGAHFRRSVAQFLPFTTSQQLDSMESGNWYFSERQIAQDGSIRGRPYV